MNDSLTSLLEKNIDLIMEAFNLDDKGNLVEANKKKVAEADEVFHNYFVKRMNQAFRQINENDPILGTAPNMHPMGTNHGMHGMGMPHDLGMGSNGEMEPGLGGDEQMGDMAMDDMHAGPMDRGGTMAMGGGMPGGMSGGMGGGMPGGMGESDQSGDFDWMFNEDADFEVDSLFNLTEDEGEDEETDELDDDHLNEFMDHAMMGGGMGMSGMGDMDDGMGGDADFLPSGDMDHDGGANDFGDDMGGEDMMTVHGHMDNGGEFEFSFDKDALGFDGGDDMGGMDDMHHEEHEPDHSEEPAFGGGEEEETEHRFGESAGEGLPGFHNGKPGKGKRGPKTSRMAIVPDNPAVDHAAPFPTPQGTRQK